MNRRRIYFIVFLACVMAFCFAFAACNKKDDDKVSVTSVTLSEESIELQMGVKETQTLIATVAPDNATNKSVSWTSSNPSVATVSDGVVTAVSAGTSDITVTTADGGKTATCTVTVEAADAPPPTPVAVTGVTLDKTEVTLKLGATTTVTLTATVAPDNATNKSVSWTSSNPSVATVSDGVVTAVSAGTSDITVTTADGGKTATCTVTVEAADAPPPTPVAVTGVTLDKTEVTLKLGATTTVTLTATVAPSNADNKTVSWTSSNPSVATVSDGVVTAVSAGTADITVTTADGGKTATCTVTVEAADAPLDYTPDGTYTLDLNGPDKDIFTTSIADTSGSGYKGTYFKLSSSSSSGTDYLYINLLLRQGKLIKISGSAHTTDKTSGKSLVMGISLKSGNGAVDGLPTSLNIAQTDGEKAFEYSYTVTTEGTIVLQMNRTSGGTGAEFTELKVTISDIMVERVELDKTTSALKVGESETLTATVLPSAVANKQVGWASSDDTVATVDQSGKVTAVKAGTATITATADGKTASCEYTVTNIDVTSVTLNTTSAKIAVGKTLNLIATVLPENATLKTVTWASSDNAVATVDQNGVVTAKGTGTVTITATADGQSATCTVEIVATDIPVTGVSLDTTSVALYVGDTLQLNVTVTPSDALDGSVEWTSSNASVAAVSYGGLVTVVGEGTATITVTSNNNSQAKATCVITATYQTFEVTFKDGNTTSQVQTVRKGETAERVKLTMEGYTLVGWYDNSALTGSAYDFSTPVTADVTLYAKWQKSEIKITYYQGNNESAAVEWTDAAAANATVEYKLESEDDEAYTQVDGELIRQISSTTARVDVLGLKGGEDYNIRVTSSSQGVSVVSVAVKKYDRSGYAHFNYTDGVGAYKDDGALKGNILVIYLTESNKHDVLNSCYVDGVKVDITQYVTDSTGVVHKGIGEIFNNRRYSGADRANVGIAKLCHVYDGVALRVVGTVSNKMVNGIAEIIGLTDFDSEGNGGTVGDSGGMARIINGKNITIEGVGEDAVIKGWGFHFVSSTLARTTENDGKSFEARNITFTGYPEDALGAEGEQAEKKLSSSLTAPVERVWVHNNTFEQGGNGSAAQGDKGEGDGSCDFKRGRYYTNSYNRYENCHKTNLVGSSSTSVQFDVTFHHNYWYNCHARQPIARCANIHYYNNFIQYTGSVAMSLRANSYTYAENNYFDGCSKVWDVSEGGGVCKYYNNIEVGTYGGGEPVNNVESRLTKVSNNCKFIAENIDYTSFDTNPAIFYYDAEKQESKCAMTDAVTARNDCLRYSGTLKRDYDSINTELVAENEKPEDALNLGENVVTVDVASKQAVNGVQYLNISNGKGKGNLMTFKIANEAEITVSGGGNVDLLRVDGLLVAKHITSYSVTIQPGVYVLRPDKFGLDSNMKEGNVSSISFKSGLTDEQRVQNVTELINAIGTVELTAECRNKIELAQSAYSSLGATLQAQVTNAATLTEKVNGYNQLAANSVITLIDEIGTVNAGSGAAISAARMGYDNLTTAQKALVTNYSVLTAAETAYSEHEVEGVNNAISALADTSTVTTEQDILDLLDEYNLVKAMYEALDETKTAQVTNYAKVTDGIAALTSALKPYEVVRLIAALPDASSVTLSDSAAISAARNAYDELTQEQKDDINIDKLTAAESALSGLANRAIYWNNTSGTENYKNSFFTVTGSDRTNSGESVTLNGVTYTTSLKMESSTSITFTTSVEMELTLYFFPASAKKVSVDGNAYDISSDGIVTVTLAAGDHKITKNTANTYLFAISLLPTA